MPYEIRGRHDRTIGALRYDSRHVTPGDIYIAINGRDDRGPQYVGAALAAGARVVLTDAPERIEPGALSDNDVTLIVVADARLAMARMALAMAGHPERRLRLIGVTGTNGKTTVTYVLRQLLEACGDRVGVIGTLGMYIGRIVPTGYTTPESPELAGILAEMADAGVASVAMEVSSHALALERVAELDFAGAAFTNLTQDHLDFHASLDEYRATKKLLFDRLAPGHPAVVNVDDASAEEMIRDTAGNVFRYGEAAAADARIAAVALDADRSRWELHLGERLGGGMVELSTPLLGRFNVWNVTAAIALGIGLGYDRATLLAAVPRLEAVPGRMESIGLGNGATAVIDYAHTPDALDNVLASLRPLVPSHGRLCVVFGCGGNRDRAKRPMMGAIAAAKADLVVVTSDNPRDEDPEAIIDEVVAGMPAGSGYARIADRGRAIAQALDGALDGDIVVIAGKGHEDYQIIGDERRPFSDRGAVTEWIRKQAVAPQARRTDV